MNMPRHKTKTSFQPGNIRNKASILKQVKTMKKKWVNGRPEFRGEKHPNWKGGGTQSERRLKEREKLVGRKKPEQCEICGAISKIVFDHNHETGKFRGWICDRCNKILGFAKDSSELLQRLSVYLKNNESIS